MKAYVVEKEALSHNIELLQKMAHDVADQAYPK